MTDAHTIGTEGLESFQLCFWTSVCSVSCYTDLQIGAEGRLLGLPLHPEEVQGNKLAAELYIRKLRNILDFDLSSTVVSLCGCAEIIFPPLCFRFPLCAVGMLTLFSSQSMLQGSIHYLQGP